MFFRLAFACLFVSAAAQAAAAQEFGIGTEWAGPYAGLSVGVGLSDGGAERDGFAGGIILRDVANGLFPSEIDDRETAVVGGATFGYAMQRRFFVAGLELDLSIADHEVDLDFSRVDPTAPPDPFAGVTTMTSYATEIDGLATLRLRAGLARGRSLFYATGGLAAGDVTNRFTLGLPDFSPIPGGYSNAWTEEGIRFGYAIGAGIEHRLSRRTSVKAELLHFDLEDVTVHAEDPPVFADNTIDYRFKNDGQILRLGINVRF